MALYPSKFVGQDRLQPGARGEKFKVDIPGYRGNEDRINRTEMRLNYNEHDTTNIKFMFDDRLPVLFRYGFAYGFNQLVIPKGRIVATDKYMDLVDFDMLKKHNTLTLANGGVPVRPRTSADKYKDYAGASEKMVSTENQGRALANPDIEWVPLIGMEKAYSDISFRPFKTTTTKVEGVDTTTVAGPKAQLSQFKYEIDVETGRVVDENGNMVNVIPGNIPIGMIIRNEYTRDTDAFNGMAPGAINTNCMVELPWFAYKDKAEGNPWGSAYGGLFPGALVKADENGRVVVSPLSYESEVATMSIAEYELERQQVIGQVYAVNTELVPEGSYRWATWALSDRKNFEEFNPDEWNQNGRRGEDSIAHTPYKSTGKYPGYPYDKNYGAHDLHMLASKRDNYDQRMQQEYQYENLGIPGLTDGYNAIKRELGPVEVGYLRVAKGNYETLDLYFRTPDVKVEDIQIVIGDGDTFANVIEGAKLSLKLGSKTASNAVSVTYENDLQGLFSIKVTNLVEAQKLIPADQDDIKLPIKVKYAKRGMAGIPTFMDWDGVVGSVKILLQK